jgi:hypothetical protein
MSILNPPYVITMATKYFKVVIPANPGSGPGQALDAPGLPHAGAGLSSPA